MMKWLPPQSGMNRSENKKQKKQILTSDPLAALQVQKKSRRLGSRNTEEIYSVTRENPLFINDDAPTKPERSASDASDKNLSDSSGYSSIAARKVESRIADGRSSRTESFKTDFHIMKIIEPSFKEPEMKIRDLSLNYYTPPKIRPPSRALSNLEKSLEAKLTPSQMLENESTDSQKKESTGSVCTIYRNSKFVQNISIDKGVKPVIDKDRCYLDSSNFVSESLPSHQTVPAPVFPSQGFKVSSEDLVTPNNAINYLNQSYVANISIPRRSRTQNDFVTESLLELTSYSYNPGFRFENELSEDSQGGETAIRELSESLGQSRSLQTVAKALRDSHYINFDSYTSHFYDMPDSRGESLGRFQGLRELIGDKKRLIESDDDDPTNYVDVESSVARKVTFSEEPVLVDKTAFEDEVFYENETATGDPFSKKGSWDQGMPVHEHLNMSHYGVIMSSVKKEKAAHIEHQQMWESYYGVPVPSHDTAKYPNYPACADHSDVCIDFTLDTQRLALIAEKERRDTICRRVGCTIVVLMGIGVFVVLVVGATFYLTKGQHHY